MKNKNFVQWGLLMAAFTLATFCVQQNYSQFQASVIPTVTAPPYDGLVAPIQMSPKWTALTSTERNLSYDQIPVTKMQPLPVYDPNQLRTPVESLGWASASDIATRNAKITYATPYMGDYKLDGLEYAGSHLAIDIKVPSNTPIYAIGNGVVVKVAYQASGFGTHIVVRHDNFPSFSDPSVKVTYYSSYNHLSQALVAEGDVVTKGELIAKSGASGLASTPHLHFQIDNDSASFHPYWPFTYQEASAAGLDFNSAIDAGLNQSKAIAATINPMLYVQKYLNGTVSNVVYSSTPVVTTLPPTVTSTPTATTTTTTVTDTTSSSSASTDAHGSAPTTTSSTSTSTTTTTATPIPTSNSNPVAYQFEASKFFIKGQDLTVKVKAVDANGQTVTTYEPTNDVYTQLEFGSANVPSIIHDYEFSNGEASLKITPTGDLGIKIKVSDGRLTGESDFISSSIFSDVESTASYFNALQFLKDNNVIGGYPDGSFKPGSVVSRVEALKFILKGANIDLQNVSRLPFKDTNVSEWYANFVATAFNKNIVDGYPDLTFKPGNTVNKAEFLKMLLTATGVQVNKTVSDNVYSDVNKSDWFAPYVQYAKDKNLIDVSGNYFKPNDGMTRSDVAEAIYRMILLKISGASTYTTSLNVSAAQISQYFS